MARTVGRRMSQKPNKSSPRFLQSAALFVAGILLGALALHLATAEKPYRPQLTDFPEYSDHADPEDVPVKTLPAKPAVQPVSAAPKPASPSAAPSASAPAAVAKPSPSAAVPASPAPVHGPRVVFVLDDWGYNLEAFEFLKEIRRPLTLAVLPALPYSERVARGGAGLGHEIILHMPMEAKSNVPREKLILLAGMPAVDVEKNLTQALATIPNVKGVSNHQGSKATEDRALMGEVVSLVQKRGLFFFDSLTTDHSAVPAAAAEFKMPYVRRDVFLDNERTEPAIQARLDELKSIALKHGTAIGIGHDKPITLGMIQRNIPEFEKAGIQIVALSDLYQ